MLRKHPADACETYLYPKEEETFAPVCNRDGSGNLLNRLSLILVALVGGQARVGVDQEEEGQQR